MMTIVRAPQPPLPRESLTDKAFQESVDRFLAIKNQPFTVSGTIPIADPLSLFFQTDNGTSYALRLPLDDEYATSPAFEALINSCEPEERLVPPTRSDSAPTAAQQHHAHPSATLLHLHFSLVAHGRSRRRRPAGTMLYPTPGPPGIGPGPQGGFVAGQFIPPHRRSLVYPATRPLAISLELASHPVLDVVKATLFPKLAQGYHLLAVRDRLTIHPSGTYTRPVHDAVYPEGVVATIMVTLPVQYAVARSLSGVRARRNVSTAVLEPSPTSSSGKRGGPTRSYGPSSQPLMVPNDALLDALADLLNQARGKNLGFFLSHEYGVSPSDVLADSLAPYLKGADALRYCAGGYIWPVDKPALILDSNRGGPQSATPFRTVGRSRSLTREGRSQSNLGGSRELQIYNRRQEQEEDADLADKVQRGGAVPLADENITLLHSPEQGHIAKERVPFWQMTQRTHSTTYGVWMRLIEIHNIILFYRVLDAGASL
ncbi:hypothetical protein RhiJN_13009 [Ceratobasidium sp. AG-Ba]|nr:hypothetical protein RhiJN_13009 [Ceratobasidium sp. AG-Ba]